MSNSSLAKLVDFAGGSEEMGRMSETMRVAVIDDCAHYRSGVKLALESAEGFDVDEAASVGEAMQLTYERRPDVIVLSGTSTEPDAGAIAALLALHPDARIVVISSTPEEGAAKAALLAGARAYLSKHVTATELIEAIRAIGNEETLVTSYARPQIDGTMRLTPREQQVLDEIARGQSNKEIARTLRISEKTVKQHITHILEKLNVQNRVGAALLAAKLREPGA